MNMNVQVIGLNELISDSKKAGMNVKPLINAALYNSVTLTQKNIRQESPHKTGNLQRSVLTTVSYPSATVQSQEKYADFVESGTKAHLILPKTKKALFWKGAMNPYRAVHHPGTKANPFFSRGVTKSETGILEQFTKVIERLVKEMAGK
jgi:HK97 gp10 family phage protein